jgi:steroid delta-isomerase-like uncharacterized protein
MSSLAENKDLVRRYVHAVDAHDIDALTRLVSEDLVNHAALPEAQGAAGMRTIYQKIFTGMPDMRATCEDLIAEGDRVTARVSIRGTHTGPLAFKLAPLPATGRPVQTEHIHVMRIRDGKIVEQWAGRDDVGMLRQIGVLPFGKGNAT